MLQALSSHILESLSPEAASESLCGKILTRISFLWKWAGQLSLQIDAQKPPIWYSLNSDECGATFGQKAFVGCLLGLWNIDKIFELILRIDALSQKMTSEICCEPPTHTSSESWMTSIGVSSRVPLFQWSQVVIEACREAHRYLSREYHE